jgi:hypothetical protein
MNGANTWISKYQQNEEVARQEAVRFCEDSVKFAIRR